MGRPDKSARSSGDSGRDKGQMSGITRRRLSMEMIKYRIFVLAMWVAKKTCGSSDVRMLLNKAREDEREWYYWGSDNDDWSL